MKVEFLEAAERELAREGQKVNISRLSIATGVHRSDVMRIHREGAIKEVSTNLITRVIGAWKTHPEYTTSSGRPRVLSADTDDSEFAGLVAHLTKDTHAGTVLFEMERVGLVERSRNGVKLKSKMFDASKNPEEAYRMLGQDSEALISCIHENVFEDVEISNLHIRTVFDNVRKRDVPRIREWLVEHGGKFHDKVEKYLAKYDQDVNPVKGAEGGATVIVNAFSFTRDK